jgi:hypothetical protein
VLRESTLTHIVTGDEKFLHRTLASVGVPPLHIVRAQNGVQYRFYELTGDLPDTLHFRHFEATRGGSSETKNEGTRVRLGSEVKLKEGASRAASGRVRLRG